MQKCIGIALVILSWSVLTKADAPCDSRLPHCQNQGAQSGGNKGCPSFWLIPGKASDCTKQDRKIIDIDPNSVSVSPNPVKLPGCFTINMKGDIKSVDGPKNFFAKVEYNWLKLPQFRSLQCQNSSANGCGGYGNNCYYCDLCQSLKDLDKAKSKNQIAGEFDKLTCPDKAGPFTFSRQFCLNNFGDLDKDGDCKFDFLQNGQAGNYQDALKTLQKSGYGTVIAKFILAKNATQEQAVLKKVKEAEITTVIDRELASKRAENNWAVDNKEYTTFRDWFVTKRTDTWHMQYYLPSLLYNNTIGCMSVSFDVCDKQPIPTASGPNTFQCPPPS